MTKHIEDEILSDFSGDPGSEHLHLRLPGDLFEKNG
jgi:hypothetical protein